MGCLLVLAVPALFVAEFYTFLAAGERIGWGFAILLVMASMMIGWSLVQRAGLQAMSRARDAMNRGQAPARSLFDGACLLGAGALLVFPGFLSDAVAILLLLPPVRWLLFRLASRPGIPTGPGGFASGPGAGPVGGFGGRPKVFVWRWTSTHGPASPPPPHGRGPSGHGGIIDAEWTEVPEEGTPSGNGGGKALPPGEPRDGE